MSHAIGMLRVLIDPEKEITYSGTPLNGNGYKGYHDITVKLFSPNGIIAF